MSRGGRRPGNPDTRAYILASARTAFAQHGFQRSTVRAIASAAGVDPALVHHYFGSKRALFLAVVEPPAGPAEVLAPVAAGPAGRVGEGLVRAFLGVWDGDGRVRATALLRTAVTDESTQGLLREFVAGQIIGPVLRSEAELPWRASLVASQMIGLAVTRYVVQVEPIASASVDDLVGAVGPTLQRYVTRPLAPRSRT